MPSEDHWVALEIPDGGVVSHGEGEEPVGARVPSGELERALHRGPARARRAAVQVTPRCGGEQRPVQRLELEHRANRTADASRVPAEWHGWLHGNVAGIPESHLPPPRIWETEFTPNATGTAAAYRPQGALARGGQRAAATGDYEAWTPEDPGST